MGVTSYYHHSQGGRGKYIEKKIASSFETCTLSVELSKFPFWLEFPEIYKRKGLFTLQGLTQEEKEKIRTTKWDWIANRDVNTDLGSIIRDTKSLILMEIKNRVDSGGTAARREIWTSEKFGIFIEYIKSNTKLFKKGDESFSLIELLEIFGIEKFEIFIGILFDTCDSPATKDSDKAHGFYSSSKYGFLYLLEIIKKSPSLNIIDIDEENLQIIIKSEYSNVKIQIGALYGDDITLKLFGRRFPVSDLLLLKYDDIWLSQLLTIDERTVLLNHKINYSVIFLDLLKKDNNLRLKYNNFINSEGSVNKLNEIVRYLIDKYNNIFEDRLLPQNKNKIGYLGDIIQFLSSTES
ncbi:MAG: hypothetical protein JXA68_08780 [Ignavibacteriales bacterium]|nr:hypothetical protein [Ignavibacteriales bacterium]